MDDLGLFDAPATPTGTSPTVAGPGPDAPNPPAGTVVPDAPFRSVADLLGLPGSRSGPPAMPAATAPTASPGDPDTVELRDAADTLAHALEARGHVLLRSNARLFISNASLLTVDDRAEIQRLKPYLLPHGQFYQPPSDTPDSNLRPLIELLGATRPAPPVSAWTLKEPPDLTNATDIILNFETNGVHWAKGDRPIGVTVGTLDGEVVAYLPFGHRGGGPQHDEEVIKRYAREQLKGKRITNANTKFEVHMARVWADLDLEEQGNTVSDVQHYAALLDDNRRKFALDVLAKDYLGGIEIPRVDERYMAEYASTEVGTRAEYQATLVSQLHAKMWPELEKQDLQSVRQLEDDVIYPVCEMEKNGAPMDRELLQQWCTDAKDLQEKYLAEIERKAGFQFNPDASSDWERLFNHLEIDIEHRTAKGAASFADAVLKPIKNKYVQLGRKAGQLASLRSKFLDAYNDVVGDDWILRYQLHQLRNDEHGTVRGRFSASDKNIQQVMNHDTHKAAFETDDFFVRRLFIAANGDYLEADAMQVEFRIFASYSESEQIIAGYLENPEMSYHKKVGELLAPYVPTIPYTKVKSYNFLKIYGGGRAKAAAYLEIPRSESDKLVDAYDKMFPEIGPLLKRAERLAKTRGFVKTVLGRRARFPDDKFAYKALNAVIQGSAADIMKRKLVELHRQRKWTNFLLRYTVHDSVCGDAHEGVETRARVQDVLNTQSFPDLRVPILWSVNIGPNWAACK